MTDQNSADIHLGVEELTYYATPSKLTPVRIELLSPCSFIIERAVAKVYERVMFFHSSRGASIFIVDQ